jgi:tight adherence protein B
MNLIELISYNKMLLIAIIVGACLATCAVIVFLVAYDVSRKERLRLRNNVSESIRWLFADNTSNSSKKPSIFKRGINEIVDGVPTSNAIPLAAISTFCVFVAAIIMTTNLGVAISAAAIFVFAAFAYVTAKKLARRNKLEDQFCRACRQIASSLRSGMTIESALKLCASHAQEPLASEFDQALIELSVNPRVSEALNHTAERTKNDDIALFATVVSLHERRGGQLAGSLETLSETISTRQSMRRRVRSESSSAKLACVAVIIISIGIFAMGWFMIPGFLDFYTQQPIGWAIVAGCVLMFVAGAIILFKMADVSMK